MNFKKILKQSFLPVLAAIILVGGFVYAWSEPTSAPPASNVPAPINVGPDKQVKVGDICTSVTGEEICLSEVVSFPACTSAGGVPTTVGASTICKFPGASCPSGWSQYLKYTETTANTCMGAGDCGTSVTSGYHAFANIDPATEARTYYDCTYYYNSCCYMTYSCPPGIWRGTWCDGGATCNGCTSSSSTAKTCMPNITFVGCVFS